METWRRAGQELAEIRQRELEGVNTEEAVRQIFGDEGINLDAPCPPTSGLIEQQAWFKRLWLATSRH
jgi:hypothetical protein